MAKIPAHCTCCGLQFFSDSFIGGTGARNITLRGNKTTCPRCGGRANFVDGIFDLQDDRLHLVDGPPLTHAMMARLQQVIDKAKGQIGESERLLAEVAEVSPELAAEIRKRGLPYFVILLVLIWLIKSVSLNITVDLNRLIDQAANIEQQIQPNDVLESPFPQAEKVGTLQKMPGQTTALSRQVRRQMERRSGKSYWSVA